MPCLKNAYEILFLSFALFVFHVNQINHNVRYLEAAATDIDPVKSVVSCASIACEGNTCGAEEFDLEYDRLIFTVGAKTVS